jgi:hypothetical protein
MVEKTFRVSVKANDRAIAGLSMGGGQTAATNKKIKVIRICAGDEDFGYSQAAHNDQRRCGVSERRPVTRHRDEAASSAEPARAKGDRANIE